MDNELTPDQALVVVEGGPADRALVDAAQSSALDRYADALEADARLCSSLWTAAELRTEARAARALAVRAREGRQ